MKNQHVLLVKTNVGLAPVQSFLSARVTMALCLAEGLDATNIGVSTVGSTVILSGEVAAGDDRLTAERIAGEVLGVGGIRNGLVAGRSIVKYSTSRIDPLSGTTKDRPEASELYLSLRLVRHPL